MSNDSAQDLKEWVAVLSDVLALNSSALDTGEWGFDTAAGTPVLIEPRGHSELKSLVISARIGIAAQHTTRESLLALLGINSQAADSAPLFASYHAHSGILTASFIFEPQPDQWNLETLLGALNQFIPRADALAHSFANNELALPLPDLASDQPSVMPIFA